MPIKIMKKKKKKKVVRDNRRSMVGSGYSKMIKNSGPMMGQGPMAPQGSMVGGIAD